jgi:hypothetical protein
MLLKRVLHTPGSISQFLLPTFQMETQEIARVRCDQVGFEYG